MGLRPLRRRWHPSLGRATDEPSDVQGCCGRRIWSALALLVARVLADHHDAAVATDHLALVTDLLHARVDLHRDSLSSVRTERGYGVVTGCSLVAVDDPTAAEVIRRELHHDPILGEDADVVLAHLAADVREHLVAVGQ